MSKTTRIHKNQNTLYKLFKNCDKKPYSFMEDRIVGYCHITVPINERITPNFSGSNENNKISNNNKLVLFIAIYITKQQEKTSLSIV